MISGSRVARALLAAVLITSGFVAGQQGPKRESGDTVARPKKKEGTATEPAAETQGEKIPSKLNKKGEGPQSPQDTPTFRSDALTVNVDVSVLDNKGRFIPGIPAGNFRIYEDGVEQKVTNFSTGDTPMTIAMVIEFSNLFQGYWSWGWQETLSACYGFLETLKPDDYVAVVAFDMRPEILSDFSNNRQDTMQALARLRIPAFTESNLYDALSFTADRMSDIEGRKAIFYIGSGMDTFSKMTYDTARRKLQTASVPIYSLGTMQAYREYMDSRGAMGSIQRLDFLQADNQLRTFSKETGGMAWFPRFLGEYPAIFRTIAEALRSTYMLTYNPTNTERDGKYRKIKVELVNPNTGEPLRVVDEKNKPMKYTIVARPGYNAPRPVE